MTPRKTVLALATSALFLTACGDGGATETKPVVAKFEAPTEGYERCPIALKNLSENAESFSWDFGNNQTSKEIGPKTSFSQAGNFVLKLIASNAAGSSSAEQPIMVRQSQPYSKIFETQDHYPLTQSVVTLPNGESVSMLRYTFGSLPTTLFRLSPTGEILKELSLGEEDEFRTTVLLDQTTGIQKNLIAVSASKYFQLDSSLNPQTISGRSIQYKSEVLTVQDAKAQGEFLIVAGKTNGNQPFLQKIRVSNGEVIFTQLYAAISSLIGVRIDMDDAGGVMASVANLQGSSALEVRVTQLGGDGTFIREVGRANTSTLAIRQAQSWEGWVIVSIQELILFGRNGEVRKLAEDLYGTLAVVGSNGDLIVVGGKKVEIANGELNWVLVYRRYDRNLEVLAEGKSVPVSNQLTDIFLTGISETSDCGVTVNASYRFAPEGYYLSIFHKFSANGKI